MRNSANPIFAPLHIGCFRRDRRRRWNATISHAITPRYARLIELGPVYRYNRAHFAFNGLMGILRVMICAPALILLQMPHCRYRKNGKRTNNNCADGRGKQTQGGTLAIRERISHVIDILFSPPPSPIYISIGVHKATRRRIARRGGAWRSQN